MIRKLNQSLRKQIINIPGFRTGRKIVVFESDDWGAVRQHSVKTLQWMYSKGMKLEHDHYIRNDSLASETDLKLLFEALKSVNDSQGKPAVMTANTVMANPDFERMDAHGRNKYYYEIFTDTLRRYPEHNNSFELWRKGISEGIFRPQFHGREHLHVHRWLEGLQIRGSETDQLFDRQIFALCSSATSEERKSYMAAWQAEDPEYLEFVLDAIKEGLGLFEKVFGYQSLTAVAPNYTWNSEMETALHQKGVFGLQGGTVQRSPSAVTGKNQVIRRYTGQNNNLGQVYMVRNCRFEPSENPAKDWITSCLNEINTAFRWRKPAIIESHRVNFVGYINPDNRDRNLELFCELYEKIVKKWPDVEFMSSDQLCEVIRGE